MTMGLTPAGVILDKARERERMRAEAYVSIDYAGANKVGPKLKAALTRAIHSGDPNKVVVACKQTVEAWSQAPFNGHWPDNWSNWQRALDDALGWRNGVDLRDL